MRRTIGIRSIKRSSLLPRAPRNPIRELNNIKFLSFHLTRTLHVFKNYLNSMKFIFSLEIYTCAFLFLYYKCYHLYNIGIFLQFST